AADLRRAAVALAGRHGAATRDDVPRAPEAPARATCFGSFSLVVDGRPLPLSGLRPRARSVLRLLALQGGRPLHREVLLASLWPETDQVSAARSMLTTLSSVRAVLVSTPAEGALSREGAAYRLDPEAVVTDVALADAALDRARRAAADLAADADGAYVAALDLYAGELLAEEGPAEWVVEPREDWRVRMAGAAHELAVLRYRRGQTAAAAAAARRGLAVDRRSDQLWRVLVAALRAGEDDVAAERAESDYGSLLSELAVG
ncbi:MAG: transcriptional regulator, family, partial [Frankiales bacterium]|nr:transcriptional regulator, family [Frankiales bacterium]